MNKPIKVITLILLTGIVIKMNAQTDAGKWQLGVNAGALIYQGDLAPSSWGSYKTPSFTAGLNISRVINPYFSVRANLVFGKLRGDDSAYSDPEWRRQRNYNFSTPVTELSAMLVWNLFGNNNNELGQRFSPYLFAGAGISWLNIKRDYSRINRDVFPAGSKTQQGLVIDSSTTLPGSIPVLPLGIGVEYYISPRFSLTAETNFRYVFTDYLDGFSYGANPDQKDSYHSHTLGLVYRLGSGQGNKRDKLGCPALKF